MGLGNFIQLTYSIFNLCALQGRKMPVYFEKDFIQNCFLDCDAIEILKRKPNRLPINLEPWHYENNGIPESENLWRRITETYGLEEFNPPLFTYVDVPELAKENADLKNKIVIMNGSGNYSPEYLDKKSPSIDDYKARIKKLKARKSQLVFIGSDEDKRINSELIEALGCKTRKLNMRQSLAVLLQAKHIVSNDTGLAHAAAAWHKPIDILWKNTPFIKNSNPGENTSYEFVGLIRPSLEQEPYFNIIKDEW